MTPSSLTIRPATTADVPTIHALIAELAAYEKLAHQMTATEDALHQTLFGPTPYAEVLIARLDGRPVGQAIFFHTYSTFLAKPGIYIEDIYVTQAVRGKGVGKNLLSEVAKIARDRQCGRIEWSVLNWNTPSIEFYEAMGATPQKEWTMYRCDEATIAKLAG